jgi:hypothetical protein
VPVTEPSDRPAARFDEYDHVEATVDLEARLPTGTRGAIVMVYPSDPAAFEVEFVDDAGQTICVRTVEAAELRKVASTTGE